MIYITIINQRIQKLFSPTIFCLLFIVILGSSSKLMCKPKDLIQSIKIKKNFISYAINKDLQKYLFEDLFVEYESSLDLEQLDYEIITMPLIMNVIPIIWISGKKFTIDSMDSELYNSLKIVKKLFQALYPRTKWNGELIPRTLKPIKNLRRHDLKKIAILFSGGLDSTSSFFNHIHEDIETITAWGAFDLPLAQKTIWNNRKHKITNFVKLYGHSPNFLRSNYYDFLDLTRLTSLSDEFYNWRLNCMEAIGWAGLTAPILLTKGCSTLFAPSSGHWDYPWADCTNPFVENSIKFAGIKIETDQYDLNRFGKNRCIVEICNKNHYSKPFIKVCQWTQDIDDTNCCKCRKCLTSIMGFLALEEDPRDYGFDITPDSAVLRTINFLNQREGCGHFDMDNLLIIQQYLKSISHPFHRYSAPLSRFIAFDFSQVIIKDKADIRSFSWEKLAEIVPTIRFPQNYRKNLFQPLLYENKYEFDKEVITMPRENTKSFFWTDFGQKIYRAFE